MSCTFKQVIDARSFQGRMCIKDAALRRGIVRLQTDIAFSDSRGGNSRGDIVLAIVGQGHERSDGTMAEA
ncbi:MAG: FcoT family thioesterase [Anaerolineae bacterium]